MPSRTPCRRTQEKYSRPWDTGSTTRCLRTMSPRLWWERRVSGEKQSAETGSMALTIRAAAPGWRTAIEHKESEARCSRQTTGLEQSALSAGLISWPSSLPFSLIAQTSDCDNDVGSDHGLDGRLEMRTVSRLDDDLKQNRLRRQIGEDSLMGDLDDIGPRIAENVDD